MAEATITLDDARRVADAAEKRADQIGQAQNIAVVDAGGNLVLHVRMGGAWTGSVDIAQNKAWTARAFDIETKAFGEKSQPGGQFFGIHASNGGRVMIFAEGIPLTRDGVIVGAVGGSGGDGGQDQRSPRPTQPPSDMHSTGIRLTTTTKRKRRLSRHEP